MATLRDDGRWMARAMVSGKRLTAYGKTEKDADHKLAQLVGGYSPMSTNEGPPKKPAEGDFAFQPEPPFLTLSRFSALTGVPVGTLQEWTLHEGLPHAIVGTIILVNMRMAQAWIDARTRTDNWPTIKQPNAD